jgi:hypothetical protein
MEALDWLVSVKHIAAAARLLFGAGHWLERRCNPFVWTKTADEILKTANHQRNAERGH